MKNIKGLNVILFFSLALNFIIGGYVAGYYVSDTKIMKKLHKMEGRYKRPDISIVDYFPQEEKKKFRKRIYRESEKFVTVKKNIYSSQKEILSIIADKEVDEEKLRRFFAKYQGTKSDLQSTINNVIIEMVMKMDFETRRHILLRGEKALERRMKFKRHERKDVN